MIILAAHVIFVLHLLTDFLGFFLWWHVADQVHARVHQWIAVGLGLTMLADLFFRLAAYEMEQACYWAIPGATLIGLAWKSALLYGGWRLSSAIATWEVMELREGH
jgi:hypothetical protein